MAAWLAYLPKSRLLLPREEKQGDEPTAEEMAQRSRLPSSCARRHAPRYGRGMMTRKRLRRRCVSPRHARGHEIHSRNRAHDGRNRRLPQGVCRSLPTHCQGKPRRRRRAASGHRACAHASPNDRFGESGGDRVVLETTESHLATVEEDRTVLAELLRRHASRWRVKA